MRRDEGRASIDRAPGEERSETGIDRRRREFRMPDVGEGLTEAEIVTWRVAAGDTVTVNQILVEIETAKAVVELPSPYAGVVGELLAVAGQTVAVGEPIIAIETAEAGRGGGAGAGTPAPGEGGAKIGEAGADGRIATLVGYGPRPGGVQRRPRRAAGGGRGPGAGAVGTPPPAPQQAGFPAAGPEQGHLPEAGGGNGGGHRNGGGGVAGAAAAPAGQVPLAKPPVRKLARDLGIDLHTLTGSGTGGVITREDVAAAASGAATPSPAADVTAPATAPDIDRREPIRGVRKAMAAAMVTSAFTAPHVTEFLTVDVTATMALRERLRATRRYAA